MRDAVSEWQALSALYGQAETLDAPELDRWLARLRGQAHPLVEPLQAMLGARAEVRDDGFLATLPRLPTRAAGAFDSDRTGERIGPYRLLDRLGAGGMAAVWRAVRDDGACRQTVALKLMSGQVGGAGFAQRLARERDVLVALDHPHIARLHDAGVTHGGQPWLAFEHVEGEPLTDWCDRARVDVRARVRLFRQVLLAVGHAHAHLVVHRDLKPANIVVSAVGDLRLLDFGIAKLIEDAIRDGTGIPRGRSTPATGASFGSPNGRPPTTAADVHALGVVLYELLCGEQPDALRTGLPTRPGQATSEPGPRPPSRRAFTVAVASARGSTVRALRRTLAPDLDAIALRALAEHPSQRYGSAEALRADLDRWLAGEPVEARTPRRVDRGFEFVRRHPVGALLVAAAVSALAAAAAVGVALGLQVRGAPARASAAQVSLTARVESAARDASKAPTFNAARAALPAAPRRPAR